MAARSTAASAIGALPMGQWVAGMESSEKCGKSVVRLREREGEGELGRIDTEFPLGTRAAHGVVVG